MTQYNETLELTDEELESYLDVALSAKTVTPDERKKLAPLLKYYAKKPHPFRACVKDNRKRFGPKTEAYCAVLKDLIMGTTKWRNQNKKGLSENTLKELFALSIDNGFFHYITELDLSEITDITEPETGDSEEEKQEMVFAAGDVVWKPSEGFNEVRREVERALREKYPPTKQDYSEVGGYCYVEDISGSKALVAEGADYYVFNFTQDAKGKVTVPDKSEWTSVEKAWIDEGTDLAEFEDNQILAEMYFADESAGSESELPDGDGLIWKPILRAGTWKYSPGGGGQATPKPITVVKDGESDKKKLVISMSELKENFENGAVEHVTIPTSHADNVLENTGFIKKLRFGVDSEGRDVLEAAHEFADPSVKEKATLGTIANTSAGILFDYIHKESGKKFRSVLAHVALTNRPWLNGMKPFGVNASENVEVFGFSEEPINDDPANVGGGDTSMSGTEFDFTSLGFSSEDELKSALEERATLKARERERDVADLCQKWQGEGKTPALVAEAKEIMMSDDGGNVVNLSEDGKSVSLSASDIVKRLVEKSTSVKLDQEVITDKDLSDDEAEDKEVVELSQDERRIASQLFFDGLSETEAVAEAKRRVAAESK